MNKWVEEMTDEEIEHVAVTLEAKGEPAHAGELRRFCCARRDSTLPLAAMSDLRSKALAIVAHFRGVTPRFVINCPCCQQVIPNGDVWYDCKCFGGIKGDCANCAREPAHRDLHIALTMRAWGWDKHPSPGMRDYLTPGWRCNACGRELPLIATSNGERFARCGCGAR